MHDNIVLGGPVWWFAAVLLMGGGLLGLFVVFDSLFSRREALAALPEPRWVYTGFQAAFLLLLLVAQVPGVPAFVSGIAVIATPFAIAQSLAYLLRAVYPKPPHQTTDLAPSPTMTPTPSLDHEEPTDALERPRQ